MLDRIVADLMAQAPDHIAVTGDLVNIGLPQEHINALAWLESLGAPRARDRHPRQPRHLFAPAAAIPARRAGRPTWPPARKGAAHAEPGGAFPFVRMLGRVAIIGVNSAVPTPPLVASGRVGEEQLARLGTVLERLGRADVFRLVLIHHPPLPGQASAFAGSRTPPPWRRCCRGTAPSSSCTATTIATCWPGAPPARRAVPVVGAPSASLGRPHKGEPLARYNLYRIAGPPWQIELVGRGLEEVGGPIVELERRMLDGRRRCHEKRSWEA